MWVKLSKKTTVPMWFLGEPKNPIISLTYINPGPVDVKYDTLSHHEQGKLIVGIRDKVLESDVLFQDLYNGWQKNRQQVSQEQPQQVTQAQQIENFRSAIEAKRIKKEAKLESRYEFLTKTTVPSMKAALKDEKDVDLIKKLIEREKIEKKRIGVLSYLKKKYKRLTIQKQKEIAKQISKSTKSQIKQHAKEEETFGYNVVESEQETVVLTPEDLIAVATQ